MKSLGPRPPAFWRRITRCWWGVHQPDRRGVCVRCKKAVLPLKVEVRR